MSNKAKIVRQRQKYKLNNWPQYNKSLKKRGCPEIWISNDIEDIWYERDTVNDGTGKPKDYTDRCIVLCYQLKLCFKQPLRQLEGFINGLFKMSGIRLSCPDYTTVCKRFAKLNLKTPDYKKRDRDHGSETLITLDSTGLKQFGKDEWHQEKHKVNARRTWKKLHLAVDENHMIQGTVLTCKNTNDTEVVSDLLEQIDEGADRYVADGGYDTKETYENISAHGDKAKIVISPRDTAVASDDWHLERNKTLDIITKYGHKAWHKMRKYGLQNYAELAMLRYKKIIGKVMHSRETSRQENEAIIGSSILNKFTGIGMPISRKIA